MTAVGTVTRLSVTPVKGTALQHPDVVHIDRTGAVGDRQFFVVDDADRLLSITRTGALSQASAEYDPGADALRLSAAAAGANAAGRVRYVERVTADFYGQRLVAGHAVDGPFSAWLSELAGEPVRLVRADARSGGIDVAPVTLLGAGSVRAVGEQLGVPLDARRFRMLIDLDCDEPFAEERWAGSVLRGERVRLRIGDPTPRCASVMRDPRNGAKDQPVLTAIRELKGVQRTIGRTGLCLGVYAEVLAPGPLRVGETLRLEPGA